MIKLLEILHTVREEEKSGLLPIENWKFQYIEHLSDIGFMEDDMYHLSIKRPPIVISYKKGRGFILEDKKKKITKLFLSFGSMCQYLENYEQQWETQSYL